MKKVFIFSKAFEPTTDIVIEWLKYFKSNVIRFNSENGFESIYCKVGENLSINKFKMDSSNAFWIYHFTLNETNLSSKVEETEFMILRDYIVSKIADMPSTIGSSLQDIYHNKLMDLELAKRCGLKIPISHLTDNKNDINQVRNESIINKPLSDYFEINYENDNKTVTLDIFEVEDVNVLPNYFFPSLLQQKVKKEFEVRSFVFSNKFYSVAIFSQLREKTSLSFKNLDINNLIRIVPFKLPKPLRKKLLLFMECNGLNSTSFDLIYGQDKNFYFIESNPIGQFNWVSNSANYYIEKKIAKKLAT